MGPLKKFKRFQEETSSDEEINPGSEMGFDSDQNSDYEQLNSDEENASDFEGNSKEEDEMEEDEEEGSEDDSERMKDAEMKELEKEMNDLRREQDLLSNLKRHTDVDAIKGQAVKNQKALWDKHLEFRILLQKTFSNSNKLPQEAIKSAFCSSDELVDQAYSDLISSCKETLNSMLDLQQALLEKNPSITRELSGNTRESHNNEKLSNDFKGEVDEEWSRIHNMNCRIAPFRDNSVDKWHKKTQVTTGAAAYKMKLHAFNQNISAQVAGYMRDPSRMIKMMQLRRVSTGIFGEISEESDSIKEEILEEPESIKEEDGNGGGDPELIDDSEFYKELVKEIIDHASEMANDWKKLLPRKRKQYARHASKSRKIRYNVHEKMVNFMAPVPMNLPAMAPKLFENLFGTRNQKTASTAVELS